jgi:hypothetical protein
LAIIDPDDGSPCVLPLPKNPTSTGYHAARQTAQLSSRGKRKWFVDTAAGKPARTV